MSGFVLNLAVLSAVFTLLSGITVIVRNKFLKGREGLLYPIWIALFILSIMPFKMTYSRFEYKSENTESIQTTDSSVFQNSVDNESITTLHIAKKSNISVSFRRLLSKILSKTQTVAAFVFAVWLIGATAEVTAFVIDYIHTKKLLYRNSSDCSKKKAYRRFRKILLECKEDMGIHRSVDLRMIDDDMCCSPCLSGIFFPIIYLEPGCFEFTNEELRCVISHELTHLKRLDIVWKSIALISASVHWFNPVAKRMLKYAFEDCELACDYSVIRTYGNGISGAYMNAILDFAERFSLKSREVGIDSGLFFAKSANGTFLKLRYVNMKNYRFKRLTYVMIMTAVICMCIVNMCVLSVFSQKSSEIPNSIILSSPVEMMIRSYYGLSCEDFITPELLDGIKTLEIRADKTLDGHILAEFVVNGEAGYSKAVPSIAITNYWDSVIEPKIADSDERSKSFLNEKLQVRYSLKSPYDHTLAERALSEMNLTYPLIREKGSIYIFDTELINSDISEIYGYFEKLGLLEAWEMGSEVFDTECLEYFSNLEEITLVGFSLSNDM